ncbi:thioesterase [Streptomyces coelicoflavus]|uniref:Thioesterase n=1 Tax=Streptomyces coelicoflavus TaxID=285562 RepID=A0A7K3PVH9_9ACTN|nr:alpha/beta fold hydrolase [Streptomyces coelicoflavus]NEB13988.1 thioesterase [Streptomyces coelicoflavus]
MTLLHVASDSRWFKRFHPAQGVRARLVCFPHAGGSATSYFALSRQLARLSPSLEVLAVQYPGRQDRRNEPLVDDVHALAAQIHRELVSASDDRPLALFGHSMGAVVAYEVARLLEQGPGAPPVALFASGRRAPCRTRVEGTHLKDDEGLVEDLRTLDGTDVEILADKDLMRMVLPIIRSDYRAIETYRHRVGPALGCPIAVLAGSEDGRTTGDELADWRLHTSGSYSLDVYSGGHFFVNDHTEGIANLLVERLRPAAQRT